jgi:hypothetical protein
VPELGALRVDLPLRLAVPELRADLLKPALKGLFAAPPRRSPRRTRDRGDGGGHHEENDDDDAAVAEEAENEEDDEAASVGGGGALVPTLDGTALVAALERDGPAARLLLGDSTATSAWREDGSHCSISSIGHGHERVSSRGISSSSAGATRARAVVHALGLPELAGRGHAATGVGCAELTALWAAWAALPKGGLRAAVAAYARHLPIGGGGGSASSLSGSRGGGSNSAASLLPPPPLMAAPAVALAVAGFVAGGRPPAAPADRSASGRTLESQRRAASTGSSARQSGRAGSGMGASAGGRREQAPTAAPAAAAAVATRVRNYNDLRYESAAQQQEPAYARPPPLFGQPPEVDTLVLGLQNRL